MTDAFDYAVEILEKTRLHEGFLPLVVYRLRHRLFAGGWSAELIRERLERGSAVAVLPYDPLRDQLLLVEQFRAGALGITQRPWLLEIVAGLLEPGEDKIAVAHRELREEADCKALALEPICEFLPSPGASTEQVALYCARIDSQGLGGVHGVHDEHEDIRVHVVAREQAWRWLEQGKIDTAPAIIALQWLQLNHQRLRAGWR